LRAQGKFDGIPLLPWYAHRIMRRMIFALLAAIAALVPFAAAQKFQPKTIKFQGDPEYTDAELLAAAGLKKGVVVNYADMQDYSKKLLASGAFASVAFKFDGQDLIFLLTPSSDLFPVRLENLPLTPGADLDAKLREQVPLYHGKVPSEGELTDEVGAALQKLLAGEGMSVTVMATPAADEFTHKLNAVAYSITAPPVNAVITRIDGVSDTLQGRCRLFWRRQ
jgi:outer membrane protein assembly factor BamA